ncbi:hypothetical protein, partial [Arenimonas sp.]|uniref:hypothetical protein n=1 Tax=Arenimonas sp. TaxID=1872635 RepID=UPI0025BE73E1
SGLGVAAQGTPNMTVAVAAGMIRIAGFFCFVSAASPTITTAHATLDRIDLVCCDWNGAVSVVAGTAAAKPVSPAIPANSISLAQVYVPAADTAIGNAQIYDKRPIVADACDIAAEFLGSSLSATVATSAGSIGEAGWTMSAAGTPGAPAFQTSTAKHPGVLRSASGTTSGNSTRLHFGSAANSAVILPTEIARMRFLVAIPTITTLAIKLGFGVDLADAAAGSLGSAGAFVEYVPATSAKWRFTTRQASNSTTNADTGADVAAATWYDFQIIRKQNGNVQFLKNGALAFEHSTNLPTTVGNVGTLVHTLTAAARNLDHDLFCMNLAPLGDRWT